MDIKKIGSLLKELRKEKGLTQEQLAEEFYVSSRTVSRWETGSNLPDIDILIGLSEYYNVDIRELLDGCICRSVKTYCTVKSVHLAGKTEPL